jgi:hypothetical protein
MMLTPPSFSVLNEFHVASLESNFAEVTGPTLKVEQA